MLSEFASLDAILGLNCSNFSKFAVNYTTIVSESVRYVAAFVIVSISQLSNTSRLDYYPPLRNFDTYNSVSFLNII